MLHIPIKNFTIGKCQLGLATILNFYGGNHYQHARFINISSFSEMKQIFSVIFMDRSIEILVFRLKPISKRATIIFPNKQVSQLRYIGEQFNGRYSYGLMLTDIYKKIGQAA